MILLPHLRLDRVEQLSPAYLAEQGLAGLLVDHDETLLPADREAPEASVAAWAEELRRAGLPVAILSNGAPDRVRRTAESLGLVATALAGKPWPSAYRRAAATLGVAPAEIAMVGDQLFTDILGARLAGLRTVLVQPRSEGGLPHTRMLRHLERGILRGGVRGGSFHR